MRLTVVYSLNPALSLDGENKGGTLEDDTGEGLEGATDLGDVGDGGEVSRRLQREIQLQRRERRS